MISRGQAFAGHSRGVDAACHPKYHFGMKTTIDGAGRVVVPKRLREQCGLSPGVELVIEVVADGVMIRPAHAQPALVDRDGVLVHHGSGAAPIDIVGLLRGEREARALGTAGQQ